MDGSKCADPWLCKAVKPYASHTCIGQPSMELFFTITATIAYKAKLQPTVAMSSTEAELIVAVYTEKVIKHLHSVLNGLGLSSSKLMIINLADAETKALSWTLHSHHSC